MLFLRCESLEPIMSLEGQTENSECSAAKVGFTPTPDMLALRKLTLCATSGLVRHSTLPSYSITSSARAMETGERASPIERAVRRLIVSLISVGSSNGSSAIFAPFKILSM